MELALAYAVHKSFISMRVPLTLPLSQVLSRSLEDESPPAFASHLNCSLAQSNSISFSIQLSNQLLILLFLVVLLLLHIHLSVSLHVLAILLPFIGVPICVGRSHVIKSLSIGSSHNYANTLCPISRPITPPCPSFRIICFE